MIKEEIMMAAPAAADIIRWYSSENLFKLDFVVYYFNCSNHIVWGNTHFIVTNVMGRVHFAQ